MLANFVMDKTGTMCCALTRSPSFIFYRKIFVFLESVCDFLIGIKKQTVPLCTKHLTKEKVIIRQLFLRQL